MGDLMGVRVQSDGKTCKNVAHCGRRCEAPGIHGADGWSVAHGRHWCSPACERSVAADPPSERTDEQRTPSSSHTEGGRPARCSTVRQLPWGERQCERWDGHADMGGHTEGHVFEGPGPVQTESEPPKKKRMGNMDGTDRGIYGKFIVRRTDGSSEPQGKHENCDYFVLDWTHDPFAIPAARAYADACEAKFPLLASDLRQRADQAAVAKPSEPPKPLPQGAPSPGVVHYMQGDVAGNAPSACGLTYSFRSRFDWTDERDEVTCVACLERLGPAGAPAGEPRGTLTLEDAVRSMCEGKEVEWNFRTHMETAWEPCDVGKRFAAGCLPDLVFRLKPAPAPALSRVRLARQMAHELLVRIGRPCQADGCADLTHFVECDRETEAIEADRASVAREAFKRVLQTVPTEMVMAVSRAIGQAERELLGGLPQGDSGEGGR